MAAVFFNFQGDAPFAVLSFLGLAFVEVVATAAAIVLFARRRARLARRVVTVALGAAGLYAALLLAFSLTSRAQVAGPGDEKYFCEVDCHLAYSVTGVAVAKTLGSGPARATARGVYRVVDLRVRFDENTIARWRPKDLTLTPNPRTVRVVDASNNAYPPDSTGERALASTEGPAIPLTRPLLPGESYTTRLVFDLPADVREPRLSITEANWVTRLVIGHENSFLHRNTTFRIAPSVISAVPP